MAESTLQKQRIADEVPEFIKKSIEYSIEREVELIIENAKKEIEKRRPEIIAGIILKAQKMISFERLETEIILKVKIEEEE